MSKKAINRSTLVSIADAIRAKTKKTDAMTLDGMIAEIGTLGGTFTPDFTFTQVGNLTCSADFVDEENRRNFMLLASQMASIYSIFDYYPAKVDFTDFKFNNVMSYAMPKVILVEYPPANGTVVSPGAPKTIIWPEKIQFESLTSDLTYFLNRSVSTQTGKEMATETQAEFVRRCVSSNKKIYLTISAAAYALLTQDEIDNFNTNCGTLYSK